MVEGRDCPARSDSKLSANETFEKPEEEECQFAVKASQIQEVTDQASNAQRYTESLCQEQNKRLKDVVAKTLVATIINESFLELEKHRNWRYKYHMGREAAEAIERLEVAARERNEEKISIEKEKLSKAVEDYKMAVDKINEIVQKQCLKGCEKAVKTLLETLN